MVLISERLCRDFSDEEIDYEYFDFDADRDGPPGE